MVDKSLVSRQEAKIRELETRLEFERTQVKRLEVGAHLSWSVARAGQSCPGSWSHACSAAPGRPRTLLRGPCQAARPADGAGAFPPPAPPALWAPWSQPALHSVSVLAFCQGTRAA